MVNRYTLGSQGTTIKIYLPRTRLTTLPQRPPTVKDIGTGGGKTVLVAEDDDAIRSVLKEMLRELGYNAIFARNGEEALMLAKKYEGSVHILLADVVMPGMNGCELAEQLSHMRPNIKVVLMSGYPKTAHPEVETTKAVFVQKPFTINQLAIKLKEALEED